MCFDDTYSNRNNNRQLALKHNSWLPFQCPEFKDSELAIPKLYLFIGYLKKTLT